MNTAHSSQLVEQFILLTYRQKEVHVFQDFLVKFIPAPSLESVAGPLVEVALHCNAISCISIKIHNGVIVGHVLKMLKRCKSLSVIKITMLKS